MATPALTQEVLRQAVGTAVRAPSVHNTQPWRFRQDGDAVLVHTDLSRWLREEDPLQRELLVSCGAALQHLRLGLRAQGLAVTHELLPDPGDPQLVGRVTVVGGEPTTPEERHLIAGIWTRHTDRSRFRDRPVPDEVVDELRRVAEADGCFLDVLGDDDVLALAALTDRGERLRAQDADRQAEQDRWVSSAGDAEGVPAEEVASRGSAVPLRGFVPGSPAGYGGLPPYAEHPLLCVLGCDSDDRLAWVTSGWALADLLLVLEGHGLVASPLTQALEMPALRTDLRVDLGLRGAPQMVLRIGYSLGAGSAQAGRRPVDEVLG